MLQRLRNFARRHKKKLIFTGVLAGGAYAAWRFVLPRLRDRVLHSVEATLLKELSRKPSKKKHLTRERYRHLIRVADTHAKAALGQLRERQLKCFDIEASQAKVRQAKSSEEKLNNLRALGVECLARLISSVYAVHLLLLLQRIQFTIVGREVANSAKEPSSTEETVADGAQDAVDDWKTHALFIEASRYFEEEGVSRIASTARKAVATAMERDRSPATLMTAGTLEELFLDVSRETDAGLLSEKDVGAFFLPSSLDPEDRLERAKVKPFLDEARDYFESPQFRGVLQALSVGTMRLIVGWLSDEAPDPAKAPLGGDRTCALAKLYGNFVNLADSALSPGGDLGLVERFAAEPLVNGLCEGLFFQDSEDTAAEACAQQ